MSYHQDTHLLLSEHPLPQSGKCKPHGSVRWGNFWVRKQNSIEKQLRESNWVVHNRETVICGDRSNGDQVALRESEDTLGSGSDPLGREQKQQ